MEDVITFDRRCDRCGKGMVRSNETLTLHVRGDRLDLCPTCSKGFRRFMCGKYVKRVIEEVK